MSASTVQGAHAGADDVSYVKPSAPGMSWTVELLVTLSIFAVVSAAAIAAIQHAGVPPLIAAATALGALVLLLTIHAIVRRAAATRPLVRTIEDLEAELFEDDDPAEVGSAAAASARTGAGAAATAPRGKHLQPAQATPPVPSAPAAATAAVVGGLDTPGAHAPLPQRRTPAAPNTAPRNGPVPSPPSAAHGLAQQRPLGPTAGGPHIAQPQPLGSPTSKAAAGPISPEAWQALDARAREEAAAQRPGPPHDGRAGDGPGAMAQRASHPGHHLEQVRPGGKGVGQSPERGPASGHAPANAGAGQRGAADHDTVRHKAGSEAAPADAGGRAQEAQLVKSILERLARDMGLKKSAKPQSESQPQSQAAQTDTARSEGQRERAAAPMRAGQPTQHAGRPGPAADIVADAQTGATAIHQRSADTAQHGSGQTHAPPQPPQSARSAEARPHTGAAAEPEAQPTAPPPTDVTRSPADDTPAARLAAVADALANERVDVFLEPIAALSGRNDGHYEVSVRLRRDDGTAMGRAVYSEVAAGTPLLPLIDTVAFAKSRSVAWRLIETKSDGQVFTALDSGSLTSAQFKDDVDSVMRASPRDTALRMVLAIPQNDVRLFSPAQTQALARLNRLGFRFAVDHLTDLETDFEGLAMAGFDFVKIDADVFLEGLPVGMVRIPAADICRYLEAVGLTPIVGHIRDDQQLAHLRDCGVAFGQGPLFGPPSLLRTDPAPSSATERRTDGIAAAGPAG